MPTSTEAKPTYFKSYLNSFIETARRIAPNSNGFSLAHAGEPYLVAMALGASDALRGSVRTKAEVDRIVTDAIKD